MYSNLKANLFGAVTIVLTSMTLIVSTSYAGTKAGGGGAGSMINGKFYTFAELGVELVEEGPQVLPEDGLEEVYKILNDKSYPPHIFPAKDFVLSEYITFRKFNTIDPQKFKTIKEEYEKSLKAPLSNFVVYAYTWMVDDQKDRTSYTELYPEFFDLTPRQQALVLIHEAQIRYTSGKTPIGKLLKIDQEVLKVMNAKEAGEVNIDYSYVYKAQRDAYSGDFHNDLKNEVLKQTLRKLGAISLDQFGDEIDSKGCLYFKSEKLFYLRKSHPLLFSELQGKSICLTLDVIINISGVYDAARTEKRKNECLQCL